MSKKRIAPEFEEEIEKTVKRVSVIPVEAKKDQPLLQRRKTTEAEQYKEDIASRSDEIQYDQVPIEDFGAALLRGMGWKEGQPVGKNPRGLVSFIDVKARPSLLGLGAEPIIDQKRERPVLPGDEIAKPVKPPSQKIEIPTHDYKCGSKIIVIDGSKKGTRGTIIGVSEKSNGVALKIQPHNSEKNISVWDDQIEFDQESWLFPNIRVRIISKSFKKGVYYKEKCIVQDVVKKLHCIVKTQSGVLLDVRQYQLETVIPPKNSLVMVVRHSDPSIRGHLAHLIESNDDKVVVQMDNTYEYLTLGLDDVSEYVS